MNKEKTQKGLLIVLMILGWFAIVAQFYLIQVNSADSFLVASVNFFSFFTILTNILVAVCVVSKLFSPPVCVLLLHPFAWCDRKLVPLSFHQSK